jgi:2-(1,2-epoxy-1,2-dihydrophenyl)acetyl-CoA isomerase
MADEALLFEVRDDGVALITLNRPLQLNALNEELMRGWRDALDRCADDTSVRAVVVTGAGRAFCAGQDLKSLQDGTPIGTILRDWYNPVILRLRSAPKPVIAAVNGAAVGAGCNLALCCDLRFAAENTRFGQVFVGIGALPDSGGFFFLPRLVGTGKAMELMLSGEIVDAREAERIGLVNRVFPAEELLPKALEYAAKLAQGPTAVFGMIKHGLDRSAVATLEEMLEYEANAQTKAAEGEDFKEGVAAFVEKRQPTFSGR